MIPYPSDQTPGLPEQNRIATAETDVGAIASQRRIALPALYLPKHLVIRAVLLGDVHDVADRALAADPGAYSITGADGVFARGLLLSLDSGAYAVAGADATLTVGAVTEYTLNLEPGVYSVTGQPARAVLELDMIVGNGLTPQQETLLDEIHRRLGLNAGAPLVNTPTNITTGAIDLVVAQVGDQVTVTRQ